MKRILWKVLIFVGTLPFIAVIVCGIHAAFTGFSGLSIGAPSKSGIQSFIDWTVMYSYLFWPTYILGIVLIGISVFFLIRNRKSNK